MGLGLLHPYPHTVGADVLSEGVGLCRTASLWLKRGFPREIHAGAPTPFAGTPRHSQASASRGRQDCRAVRVVPLLLLRVETGWWIRTHLGSLRLRGSFTL